MVSAVVLAGHSKFGELRDFNKAMLEIGGKWVVEYVVSALEKSKKVDDIVIVGPKEDLEVRIKNHRVIDDQGKFILNCLAGYSNSSNKSNHTLFMYSDIPLVNTESIEYIINNYKKEFDMCIPVAKRDVLLKFEKNQFFQKLDNFKYLKLKDGWIRTANSALVNCSAVIDKVKLLQDMEESYGIRKLYKFSSKIGLFLKLGALPLFKYYITNDLKLKDCSEFLTRRSGIKFYFFETPFPETSIDIDFWQDYVAISNYMRKSKLID
ncbi:MAG: NTP transferase domain-containing protein [Candidatus Nanoarchaeia archaeon]